MKNPSDWNKEDLHKHLQHALDLELWTIPLYLTALYSIKGLNRIKPSAYPDEAKLIYSVVVQEMLHLELVSNICNALGFAPRLRTPVYDDKKGVPFIHPNIKNIPEELRGYEVKTSALSRESLKLFCVIELPHTRTEINWKQLKSYDSIATLYEALAIGIVKFWDELYVGDEANTRQKENFNEYRHLKGDPHGFSQIVNSRESALKAIEAIVSQGEGADTRQVPLDFRPVVPPDATSFDASWYKGGLSHYNKFRILLHHNHLLPPVYEEKATHLKDFKNNRCYLEFTSFIEELEKHFNQEGKALSKEFWSKMTGLGALLIQEWEEGRCPHFG